MNRLKLSSFGTTFATRERAGGVVEGLGSKGGSIEVDFDGVKAASPSFLDELLGALATRYRSVSITGLSPSLVDLVESVIDRRGLRTRIRILATI